MRDTESKSERESLVVELPLRDIAAARPLLVALANADWGLPLQPIRSGTSACVNNASLHQAARNLIARRNHRQEVFGIAEMFGEPAWDMLLFLYASHGPQTIGSLSECVGTPATTGLRWLNFLEQRDLIERCRRAGDRRAVYVKLTAQATQLLERYLSGALTRT